MVKVKQSKRIVGAQALAEEIGITRFHLYKVVNGIRHPSRRVKAELDLHGQPLRYLTPLECERLMGFPDGYTDIPYRGRAAPKTTRYKALGNGWAINCAR